MKIKEFQCQWDYYHKDHGNTGDFYIAFNFLTHNDSSFNMWLVGANLNSGCIISLIVGMSILKPYTDMSQDKITRHKLCLVILF